MFSEEPKMVFGTDRILFRHEGAQGEQMRFQAGTLAIVTHNSLYSDSWWHLSF